MIFQALKNLVLAHPHDPAAVPIWVWLVSLVAVAAGLVAGWAVQQKQRLLQQLGDRRGRVQQLEDEAKSLQEQFRKHERGLEEKRADFEKLKVDLAAQKKKTHQAQEETRVVRAEVQSVRAALEEQRNARPAFADAPKPVVVVAPPPKPVVVPPPAPAPVEVAGPAVTELQEQLNQLREVHQTLQQRARTLDEEITESNKSVERMRKRVEDYRRIDMVSKGKVEVLEDRLRQLGRQYYDVISEIAVLKGEVPPLPRPAELAPQALDELDAEAEEIEAATEHSADGEEAPPDGDPERVLMTADERGVAAFF